MICVFIRSLTKGGSEKQSIMLAIALNKRYSAMLVVFHGELIDDEYLRIISDNKINLVRLKGGLLKKLSGLYGILRKNKVEIIFSYLLSDNIWGAIIGKIAGVKNIIGGIRNSVIPFWKLLVMKILHHLFQNYTIFNNKSGRDFFVNRYRFNPPKSLVIHNCFINIPPTITRNVNEFVKIFTVGRFVGFKDYDTALKSISHLKQINNSQVRFKFLVVGYGELEIHIRELVEKLNLKDIVEIIINPKEIPELFRESDIYLSTSKYEGLSNSIMEAMAYSLPVVATNVGDNYILIKDGINGFLTEKGNPGMISEKLLQLVKSNSLRIKMGTCSHERLIKDFTFDQFSANYYSLIDTLRKGA